MNRREIKTIVLERREKQPLTTDWFDEENLFKKLLALTPLLVAGFVGCWVLVMWFLG